MKETLALDTFFYKMRQKVTEEKGTFIRRKPLLVLIWMEAVGCSMYFYELICGFISVAS